MKRLGLLAAFFALAAGVIAIAAPAPAPSAAATCSENCQKTRALERTIERQGKALRATKRALETARVQLRWSRERVASELEKVEALEATINGGVGAQIRAAPLETFRTNVLVPALERWPCDSVYVSGSYWSYDFNNLC